MDNRTRHGPSSVFHQVLGAVSHELRGPLGVARGYLRLLEGQIGADPRAQKTVEQASQATAWMAALLDELSEYARWVRGEHALAPAPASLRHVLVEAASAALLPATPQVRVEVDALVDVIAPVDTARLAGAWSALITAVARAQTDDATVVLALRPLDHGHAVLRIVPHHLLDAATAERPPDLARAGAGLAIALAVLLVQRHGGHLAERWLGEVWAGYVCWVWSD
jgi:signal transduction histidine kinase